MIRTLLRISLHKIIAFFGGFKAFLIVCIMLCLCLGTASVISGATSPDSVSVAIVDLCNGPLSRELCKSLSATEGIKAETVYTRSEGEDLVLFDSAEILLILDSDYDRKIRSDTTESLVSIQSAPGSDSAQLLRETMAGLLISQRSELRVREALVAEGLVTENDPLFSQYMRETRTPHMYSVEVYGSVGGKETENSDLLRAGYDGVACLVILLILLTLTRRMSDIHSKNVSERIETQQYGRSLSLSSDFLALFVIALLISLITFLLSPEKRLSEALSLISYSICVSGICLLVSQFNTTGRIDILAPFLAIFTSIVGGCFTDLSVLSDALRIIARCVPQGQMLAAARGMTVFYPILIAEGIAAILLSMLLCRRSLQK